MNKSRLLEQLYLKYRFLMYHVAYRILNDHSLAEDAVHAAFLKLTKNNFEIGEINCKKTKNFMVIIVRNAAFTIYQKVYKNENINLAEKINDLEDIVPTPLELIVSNESIEKLQDTLRTLNSKYADVLILKYLYDYPIKKIAELLSISEDNVYVRLHRAKKILAAELHKGDVRYE